MIHTPEVGKCNEVHRKRTKKKIYPQKKSKLNLHDGKKKNSSKQTSRKQVWIPDMPEKTDFFTHAPRTEPFPF